MKDVRFVGSSLDELKNFPAGARREADIALAKARYKALAEERKRR